MTNLLKPGKYVVAVSGGVDSAALLDMLSKDKKLKITVAHFDHGIRPDSSKDAEFVKDLANKYELEFVGGRAELGPKASEAAARKHRYRFLNKVLKETKSLAIVTAHHQDDRIETALINIIRGTKRKGLVSLKSTEQLQRPLLSITKDNIKKYAVKNNLKWREDSTNSLLDYQRNKIRHIIKNSLNQNIRQKILKQLELVEQQDDQIQQIVKEYLSTEPKDRLNKTSLNAMPAPEASEITAQWLRENGIGFDKKTIERIVCGARKLQNGSQIDIQKGYYCLIDRSQITLKRR